MSVTKEIIWNATASPVRLGDARETWSHEKAKFDKDRRTSLQRVKEQHPWVDVGAALADELEAATGQDKDYDDDTLVVPLDHWKNHMVDFERDLADKHRKSHSDQMKLYRETDRKVKALEQEKAVLHDKLSEEEFIQAEFQRKRLRLREAIVEAQRKEKMYCEKTELLKEDFREECVRTGIAQMEYEFLVEQRRIRKEARDARHCCNACCTHLCFYNPNIRRECRNCKCDNERCCQVEWLLENLDPQQAIMEWMRVRDEIYGHGASYISPHLKKDGALLRGGGIQVGRDKR